MKYIGGEEEMECVIAFDAVPDEFDFRAALQRTTEVLALVLDILTDDLELCAQAAVKVALVDEPDALSDLLSDLYDTFQEAMGTHKAVVEVDA